MNSKVKHKGKLKNIKPSLDIQYFIDQSSDESVRKMNQELMVGKYIEECRNAKTKDSKPGSRSPYVYSNEMVNNNNNNSNNTSRDIGNSYDVNKTYSQITASKFLPHPPRKGRRPDSAPVYQLGIGSWTEFEDMSNSETSSVAMFSTASTARKYKPIYKRKKRVLCVLAFVNGSRETYARVTAPDLPQLLVECTTKLGLNTAARKLFLRDGTQVVHPKMLIKDCEVFVSTGEPFKDPIMNLEGREKLRKSSYWTLNGIQVPSSAKKSKWISSAFTRRMTESEQKRRILVFRNGECSDGVEVIAGRYDEFLIDCTTKLGMTSNVRGIYDWTGNAIEDLASVPMLNKVLQPSTGIVLGPLWATKGETFSPKGAYNFLSTMVMNTKDRMGECRDTITRLQGQMLEQKALMDVEAEIDEQRIVLEELQQALVDLKTNLIIIKESFEEEEKAYDYKFKHINEIDSNSRLVGPQTLKVWLYRNGIENADPKKMFLNIKHLKKGTMNKVEQMNNLFDHINASHELQSLFGVHGIKVKVRRMFLVDGTEITDLDMLGQDEQQLFLSEGESFLPVNYSVLSLTLEKAKVHNLWGFKEIVLRDLLMGADPNQTMSKLWNVVTHVPAECDTQEMKVVMSTEEKVAYLKQSSGTRIRNDATYIQSKQDQSLVLYPEPTLLTMSDESDTPLWGEAVQQWSISPDGLITNRHFKNLYLGILEQSVGASIILNGTPEVMEVSAVGFYSKPDQDTERNVHPNCYWQFTTDGFIQCCSNPSLVLTAVNGFKLEETQDEDLELKNQQEGRKGSQQWEITNQVRNQIVVTEHHSDDEAEEEMIPTECEIDTSMEKSNQDPFKNIPDICGGENINLVAMPTLPIKHPLASTQRWAIKSKEQSIPGGLCNKWMRQRLCWPVNQSGHGVDAPIEGFLMFGAPRLKWKSGKGEEVFNVAIKDPPLKVRVLRNGETDLSRAVVIVIPPKKNERDGSSCKNTNGVVNRSRSSPFTAFLDNCTHALRLPSAARRAFTADGKELTSVDLERDDIVYVSVGEAWMDPSLSYVEQHKAGLLATLVSDVQKIRRYVELKDQAGFVVAVDVETMTVDGGRVYLTKQSDEDNNVQTTTEQQVKEAILEESVGERSMTAHERTHAKLDVTSTPTNEDISEETQFEEENAVTPTEGKFNAQQWIFSNGFIQLKANTEFVLGVTQCKLNQKVMLLPKKLECPYQLWTCGEEGVLALKYNLNMVLTVATPPKITDYVRHTEFGVGYEGAKLIVTHRKMLINGCSNQLFALDEKTSFLQAFVATVTNKNLTAANKGGVCSFAVFGSQEVPQPGFIWQGMDDQGMACAHAFCDACGKAIRGKENLHTLTDAVKFVCAMGQAREKNIKFTGAFQSLNGKVDLSEEEHLKTLETYDQHLRSLREKSRLRVIASELSMATNPAIRVLAYKNGETNHNKGFQVIGRTIPEILDLCTQKLELQQAARRLYTLDGEIITHMHQLLTPYYPELTKPAHLNCITDVGDTYQVTRLDLRVPIIVWVSVGEPFIPADGKRFRKYAEKKRTGTMESDLPKDKGERGSFLKEEKPTRRPSKSKKDGSMSMAEKFDTMKLYQLPQALRLNIFANGESPAGAQMIFAGNLVELLDNASTRLGLTSCARRVFTNQGKEITKFSELTSDQTVAVTCGERFVPHKYRRSQIEMRASWSRANRMGEMEHGKVDINYLDMDTNRALTLGENPRTHPEEKNLLEYTGFGCDDGQRTTEAVLNSKPRLL